MTPIYKHIARNAFNFEASTDHPLPFFGLLLGIFLTYIFVSCVMEHNFSLVHSTINVKMLEAYPMQDYGRHNRQINWGGGIKGGHFVTTSPLEKCASHLWRPTFAPLMNMALRAP